LELNAVRLARNGYVVVLQDVRACMGLLPLADPPRRISSLSNYGEWLAHSDEYWRQISISERYSSIDVPGLHAGGWKDIFLKETLENYAGLRAGAASDRARETQYLVITPWGHGLNGEVIGDLWFGREASVPLTADLGHATRVI
jgi:predicted acyl esterase